MNVFIVYAHHEPQSFNGALLRRAQETLTRVGHDVVVSDLYAMNFNPVSDRRNFTTTHNPSFLKQQAEEMHATETKGFAPDVEAEIRKVERCDALIFQCPLWWFGLPAILKGWVDRVFAMGRTYGGGKWYENGAFKGKKALLSMTTGGPAPMYSAIGLNGDINHILFPVLHGMFAFTGFTVLPPFLAWGAAHTNDEGRAGYLNAYEQRLLTLDQTEPIYFPPMTEYDPKTFCEAGKRFMVRFERKRSAVETSASLGRTETQRIEELRKTGKLLDLTLSEDGGHGFMLMRERSVAALQVLLETFPPETIGDFQISPLASQGTIAEVGL
jgi:NAD(P)H dehydrogenase (quinone)